ncbi:MULTISPECIES: DUF6571 family protein [Streptomyces]|uniref:AG2 protein n=2 Tax=Streptomyces TaxID=1883 RepID=A0A2U9P6T8_STRAS|nr:DUF6571 family protein [Streptomyces actuosus]AWT45213.1 hypothetical protein DMT42_24960 [Streptomyces actuosus]MBM4821805.1 hypothetical protein [Streptomyces actuosus]
MDLDALRYGNFHQLGEAIDDWEGMAKNLKKLATEADRNLKGKADKAHWAGKNATVSREFIVKTVGEFSDAHTQADTVAKILKDTHGELVDYRTQLNDAIERAHKKHLTVIDTGDGSFTVSANTRPDWASDPSGEHGAISQQDVDAARDEIQGILSKATESDSTAAKALRLIVDQAKYGFSGASYGSRDAAAQAIEEAEKMAKILAKDPHKVTNTELATLNSALAKYKDDPLFAEEFTTRVGPKRVLTFWAGIADPYQGEFNYDPERDKQAKQLQKNLGMTLGRATLSDSDKMTAWKSEIVKLGPNQLGIDDASNPTGYGVMSNLMRFGDYDDDFLYDYGDNLFTYDKQVNGQAINPWINNANTADLNLWGNKNDRGRDPMTGFLEALGHNPGASEQFFARPDYSDTTMTTMDRDTVDADSEVNEHLRYLTKERVWMPDTAMDGKDGYVAGRNALGHALEAATTGYPSDADAKAVVAGDRRTANSAGVMEQIVYLYGSKDGPAMLHGQPELADSLGKIGGAYIDDIDRDISGVSDYQKNLGNDFPARYDGHATFGNQGAINFLSVLGQNEDSHKIVTAAQHIYTLSLLDSYPPSNDGNVEHARDAMVVGAEARGILDHSRAQQVETTYKDNVEAANKALARSADWKKLIAGAVVAGGVAAVPLPGSTAAALFLAPLAADQVQNATNTLLGHEIDKATDAAEAKWQGDSQLASEKFFGAGANDLGKMYDSYLNAHPDVAQTADRGQWAEDIKSAYTGTGALENDYRGLPPYSG